MRHASLAAAAHQLEGSDVAAQAAERRALAARTAASKKVRDGFGLQAYTQSSTARVVRPSPTCFSHLTIVPSSSLPLPETATETGLYTLPPRFLAFPPLSLQLEAAQASQAKLVAQLAVVEEARQQAERARPRLERRAGEARQALSAAGDEARAKAQALASLERQLASQEAAVRSAQEKARGAGAAGAAAAEGGAGDVGRAFAVAAAAGAVAKAERSCREADARQAKASSAPKG